MAKIAVFALVVVAVLTQASGNDVAKRASSLSQLTQVTNQITAKITQIKNQIAAVKTDSARKQTTIDAMKLRYGYHLCRPIYRVTRDV